MKRFQKREEDFVCENCKERVKGGGYTDHCPKCLFSKHVDVFPGDRRGDCGGLMEPIGAEIRGRDHILHYRCLRCGHRHHVRSVPEDDKEMIIDLSTKRIDHEE